MDSSEPASCVSSAVFLMDDIGSLCVLGNDDEERFYEGTDPSLQSIGVRTAISLDTT